MKRWPLSPVALRAGVLQLQLTLQRVGIVNVVAAILALAMVMSWNLLIPHWKDQALQQQFALEQAKHARQEAVNKPPPARPLDEMRLAEFYDTLGELHYAEQQVKTLFAAAAKTNLNLDQAEYKATFEQNGRFHTYQIVLPVKGPYAAIRQFCEQVLLAIPFASLDQITFKRESITNTTIEARLHFTLYLSAPESRSDAAIALGDLP